MPTLASFCHQCGTGLSPGSRFCPGCGLALDQPQASPGDTAAIDSVEAEWADVLRQLRQVTLGQYDIGALLGAGGMAAVFLAHQVALERKVAIKVLRPSLLAAGASEEAQVVVSRFRQEAKTIASFRHPNIVDIYEVRESKRLNFFVMEFIQGRSLDRVLRDEGMLAVPVARAIIGQVAGALAYAHRRGVVHRDIKPANIMLDHEGNAIVTDFGIAKVAESQQLTRTNYIVGTPAYLSPEQCRGGTLSGATDQYALGVVAYELLAGAPPFREQFPAILYAHLEQEPPSLRTLRPDCPPELETTVLRMLAKEPERRFASLTEAVDAMRAGEALDHATISAELIRLSSGAAGTGPALPTTPHSPTPSLRPERSPISPAAQSEKAPVSGGEASARQAEPPHEGTQTPTVSRRGWAIRIGAASALAGAAIVLYLAQRGSEPVTQPATVPDTTSPVIRKDSVAIVSQDSTAAAESTAHRAPPAAEIRGTVRPAALRLRIGQSGRASVLFENPADSIARRALQWRSSDGTVAAVDQGMVTARAAGAARISAWLDGRELGGTRVTVVADTPTVSTRAATTRTQDTARAPAPAKVTDQATPPSLPPSEESAGLRVATQCLMALEARDTLSLSAVYRRASRKDRDTLARLKSLFRNREWQTRVQVLAAPAPVVRQGGTAHSFSVVLNYRDSFGDNQSRKAVFTVEPGADGGPPACYTTDRL